MTRGGARALLARLAGQHEREAAHELARARQVQMQIERRLAEFDRYGSEYRARLPGGPRGLVRAGAFANREAFLGQLDDARAQLAARAAQAATQSRAREVEWRAARTRRRALEQVREREMRRERRHRLQLEQRRQDEASSARDRAARELD